MDPRSRLVKINKYLASHSSLSRREIDQCIFRGEVKVNGSPVELGSSFDPRSDRITLKGRPIKELPPEINIKLHKPAGFMVTRSDPKHRKTIYDLITVEQKIVPVGRLDYNSSGLLLLTNNGELLYRLTHPRFRIERTYRVKIYGTFKEDEISLMANGMFLDGMRLNPVKVVRVSPWEKGEIVHFTLLEGRNREVRRLCQLFQHDIRELERIAYGGVELKKLKPGEWQHLSSREIWNLKSLVELK